MTHDQLLRILGDNVRARRKDLSMTQVDLAESAGITQAFVSQIESGSVAATLSVIAKVAEALRTTPDLLIREGTFSQVPA